MIENGRVTVEAPPQTALPELRWPDVSDDARDVARALADAISRQRSARDLTASVQQEQELPLLVARMIDGARQQPQALGLHASTAERLAADPDFRSRVHRGAVVLASCIHPLSRLVYLGDGLEEVHVNRWDKWVLTRGGQKAILGREGNPFRNNEQVLTFFRERVIQLPGFQGDRQLNEGHPIAEGNLGTLLRCCVVQRPAVTGDSSVIATVRLPTAVTIRALDDYVTQGCMPFGVAQFLAACVAGKVNLIIAGGTATGKTTLLRVLCGMIPPVEQVLVIEDSAELHLEHDRGDGRQWHPLAQQICTVAPTTSDAADAGVSMRQLVRTALRLRPDRIILGEARDSAMAEACSAATTGHAGSMVSIHADGAMQGITRAAQYVMMSPDLRGAANLTQIANLQVHQAFDVVLHLAFDNRGRRVVSGVVALGDEPGQVDWLYRHDAQTGGLRREVGLLGDLPPNLRRKLQPVLPGREIPNTR
jgi:pilus assembly protein CpaF